MRLGSAAIATFALALFTASPAALAGPGHHHHERPDRPDRARAAANLMQAADRFDTRATAMRTRASKLRATALDLRKEAEELATSTTTDPATDATTDPGSEPEMAFRRAHPRDFGGRGAADPCTWEDDFDAEDFARHRRGGGFFRDEDRAPYSEVCELLDTAERFELRADALDAAADRMAGHATKLRDKAASFLRSAGERSAHRLLAKAKQLRAKAQQMRDRADRLRDRAFDGAEVNEQAVAFMERVETRAATFDKAADRFEARAKKATLA